MSKTITCLMLSEVVLADCRPDRGSSPTPPFPSVNRLNHWETHFLLTTSTRTLPPTFSSPSPFLLIWSKTSCRRVAPLCNYGSPHTDVNRLAALLNFVFVCAVFILLVCRVSVWRVQKTRCCFAGHPGAVLRAARAAHATFLLHPVAVRPAPPQRRGQRRSAARVHQLLGEQRVRHRGRRREQRRATAAQRQRVWLLRRPEHPPRRRRRPGAQSPEHALQPETVPGQWPQPVPASGQETVVPEAPVPLRFGHFPRRPATRRSRSATGHEGRVRSLYHDPRDVQQSEQHQQQQSAGCGPRSFGRRAHVIHGGAQSTGALLSGGRGGRQLQEETTQKLWSPGRGLRCSHRFRGAGFVNLESELDIDDFTSHYFNKTNSNWSKINLQIKIIYLTE